MSDHQETIDQTVKRIEASFNKIGTYAKKVDDHRITAGKLLVELEARIVAGEAGTGMKWWAWYAEHFKNRTRRDAQKVMALARADDPKAAAEEEREKAREGMAAQRKRVAAQTSQPEDTSNVSRGEYRWTEDDYAAQIVRDVLAEVANLESHDLDLDVVRETIILRLTEAFWPERSAQASADARKAAHAAADAQAALQEQESGAEEQEAPAKKGPAKRGRPQGSKNKPKAEAASTGNGDADEPTPEPAATVASEETVSPPTSPDDGLDIRGTSMDRRNETSP